VDGIDVVNDNTAGGVDAINAGLFPAGSGESHQFRVLDNGAATPRDISMTSADITSTPVQYAHTISTPTGAVGYLLFNDHIATAESELVDAFNQLGTTGVQDLVLDLRYNGGGYLDIASEVAYMIAGPASTAGVTFELQQFNDQYSTVNPVTGETITPVPFHSTTQGFTLAEGQPLPTLNLSRVYVLTGSGTCSASEAIINGLRGAGINVIQIGNTTCGKPYGFYPQDNCGTTYFSIEFRGVNAAGFGDYTDGFTPGAADSDATVRGCTVADDFTHLLGDSSEARLAAALAYRSSGSCPGAAGAAKSAAVLHDAIIRKSPLRENRILRRSPR
ncbi:MAG TPA: S41 family peptidase, partial [Nevskiaceae bacterium]|nr:S41 family peptidase [Nevskiaceae bacterium]